MAQHAKEPPPLEAGMIGVGNIGLQMALRLMERGLKLKVCDRNPAAVAAAVEAGAGQAASPAELAERCAVILVSMPSAAASLEVALGERGVVHRRALKAYIETSTLGSAVARRIADGLAPQGIGFVDAPVSGGRVGARAGVLAIMTSGPQAACELARPVLDALAARVFHLGERAGLAQIAKASASASGPSWPPATPRSSPSTAVAGMRHGRTSPWTRCSSPAVWS
ncbi:MAG: NAD(P)-binding domain-containing protein [Rubrivivax sp.]|nr:NAD(P)-binding domain-containing protein [Rubrivivax sp.]